MLNFLSMMYFLVILRASLCPNLSENTFRLFRYDRVTRKCYRGGDRGPCGENMIFYPEDDSRVYGICDCDGISNERPLIFHPESNQCHFVYSRVCNGMDETTSNHTYPGDETD